MSTSTRSQSTRMIRRTTALTLGSAVLLKAVMTTLLTTTVGMNTRVKSTLTAVGSTVEITPTLTAI